MPEPPRRAEEVAALVSAGPYADALARVAVLLARKEQALPLSRLELRQELAHRYAEHLPDLPADQWRRIRGIQEILVRQDPEQALAGLPALLADGADRARLLALLDKLATDRQVLGARPTAAQKTMLERLRGLLAPPTRRRARRTPA